MTDDGYDRDYKYLDPEELKKEPIIPCNETPPDALMHGLLDLIQLAESEGLDEETTDGVLRRIIDLRAKRVRSKFTILGPDKS